MHNLLVHQCLFVCFFARDIAVSISHSLQSTPRAVEVVIKKEMRQENETAMNAGFKGKLLLLLQQDEDVLFWWSTLCAITDVDETMEAQCKNKCVTLANYLVTTIV